MTSAINRYLSDFLNHVAKILAQVYVVFAHACYLYQTTAGVKLNPWIVIDFGWTRLIDGTALSQNEFQFLDENSTFQVKFGFEDLW